MRKRRVNERIHWDTCSLNSDTLAAAFGCGNDELFTYYPHRRGASRGNRLIPKSPDRDAQGWSPLLPETFGLGESAEAAKIVTFKSLRYQVRKVKSGSTLHRRRDYAINGAALVARNYESH